MFVFLSERHHCTSHGKAIPFHTSLSSDVADALEMPRTVVIILLEWTGVSVTRPFLVFYVIHKQYKIWKIQMSAKKKDDLLPCPLAPSVSFSGGEAQTIPAESWRDAAARTGTPTFWEFVLCCFAFTGDLCEFFFLATEGNLKKIFTFREKGEKHKERSALVLKCSMTGAARSPRESPPSSFPKPHSASQPQVTGALDSGSIWALSPLILSIA